VISVVVVAAAAEARLRDFAIGAYPHEGCGVLIGTYTADGVRVLDVTSARNLWTERAADRYDLDPDDMLAAQRSARQARLDVVGIWHSHPDHPAWPSQFDSDRAWVDFAYLICRTVAAGAEDLNAFAVAAEGEDLGPVELRVEPQ